MAFIRSVLAAAILLTPLGMIWVFAGDGYLPSSGLYPFLLLLWATHFAFWIVYVAVTAPLLAWLAGRVRRVPGEAALACAAAGLAGLGYLIWASVRFLHRDLGFFTPRNLAVNLGIFLLFFAAGLGVHLALRRSGLLVRRAALLAAAVGSLLTAGLWAATFVMTPAYGEEVSLEPTEEPQSASAATAGGGAPAAARRVTLLGLDGGDWRYIDPLIARGGLPAFTKLRRGGATASLETISPFSPVVWTSIATGMDPGRHSVQYFSEMYFRAFDMPVQRLQHNFLEPLYSRVFEKIPVSSTTRTAKAVWEIAGGFGLQSLVMNWWASFPVEPIPGVLVSNYAIPWDEISAERLADWESDHKVHPEELWPLVLDVMRKSVEGGIRATSWMGDDPDEQITRVDFWDLRDRIVLDLYLRLHRPEHAFTAIYLQGIDTTSHHVSETIFGNNADLERESRVAPALYEEKRAMVDDVYRRMDLVLGTLMEGMGEGDLLVVVSDHGWLLDGTSHWRQPDGILGLYGSGVKEGFSPGRVHVYDVAPTLLYYLGLPLSRELPGRVLEEAFDPAMIGSLPRAHVASYGRRAQPMRMADPATDAAYRERLKSLGYIQ